MADSNSKTKILFDGNCIVCDMEISHYKKIAPELFELLDISAPTFDAGSFGLTVEAVMRDMHVFTPEGQLRVGVDAFAHIWDRIEKFRWMASCVRMPLVYPLAKFGYKLFTVVRPWLPKKHRH